MQGEPARLAPGSTPNTPEPAARGEAEGRASPTHAAENKLVTVLCCGLGGPVVPAVPLGPETRHRRLQAFAATAQTVIPRYGGTITQQT